MTNSLTFWVREYRCNNPDCCDGYPLIQVTHKTDTKMHYCTWCNKLCEYVKDIKTFTIFKQ